MLIFTKYIAKHEFRPLRRHFGLEDILEGGRKILKNLAVEVKPPGNIQGIRFFKVRIGSKVMGRMIVFLMVDNKKIVPLLIRLKKDKIFGENREQLKRNLERVLEDIQAKRYEEFSL